MGRNRLKACRTEALTSPDCDAQIGVQTFGECKNRLPAYSASNPYTIEALFDRGRSVPHVRWEAEAVWPAAKPEQAVVPAQLRQMQSAQFWAHTNPHYVILQCGGLTCFQIAQIRSIWTNTCPRKPSAPIFGLGLTYLFSFSILKRLSLNSCLQALSRAFCHTSG